MYVFARVWSSACVVVYVRMFSHAYVFGCACVRMGACVHTCGVLACVCAQADREVVLSAVAQSGEALRYVAEPLRFDREVVLTAVSNDGQWYPSCSLNYNAYCDSLLRSPTLPTVAFRPTTTTAMCTAWPLATCSAA